MTRVLDMDSGYAEKSSAISSPDLKYSSSEENLSLLGSSRVFFIWMHMRTSWSFASSLCR